MAIDTQQAKVDSALAFSALHATARSLDRAINGLPPFALQARELGNIKSDALDLAARLEKVFSGGNGG